MADTDFDIFDAEFATRQFSGNHSLLIQILGKFVQQHQNFDSLLTEQIEQGEIQAVKQLVHTLKGVSGNLGMTALYNACKVFEGQVENQVSKEQVDKLLDVFTQTLIVVKAFTDVDGTAEPQSEVVIDNQKAELIAALKRNEFISDNKMQQYLSALDLEPKIQQQLQQAINDLDYPAAIHLLA